MGRAENGREKHGGAKLLPTTPNGTKKDAFTFINREEEWLAVHALRHQVTPFLLQACDVWAPSSLLKKELHFLLVLRELGRSMHPVKPGHRAQHLDTFWNGIVGFVLGFEYVLSPLWQRLGS